MGFFDSLWTFLTDLLRRATGGKMTDIDKNGDESKEKPIQDDAWVDETARKMLAAIEKNEVLAAVLTLKVGREIRRYAIAILAIFGVSGFGGLLYLSHDAVDEAKRLLSDSVRTQIGALNDELRKVQGLNTQYMAKIDDLNRKSAEYDLRVKAIDNTLKSSEAVINGDNSKSTESLGSRIAALNAAVITAQPIAERFNKGDLKALSDQLTPEAVATLNAALNSRPRDALLLTRVACPTGWTDDNATASGAVLAVAPAKGSLEPWNVTLKEANLPQTAFSGPVSMSGAMLSLPTVRVEHPLTGARLIELDTCSGSCSGRKPLDPIPASLAPMTISGSIGSAHPTGVPLGKRLEVHVCRQAAP